MTPLTGDGQLRSIVDEFTCRPGCPFCHGEGYVCEDHPGRPWYPVVLIEDGACDCGAAGMPCPGGLP